MLHPALLVLHVFRHVVYRLRHYQNYLKMRYRLFVIFNWQKESTSWTAEASVRIPRPPSRPLSHPSIFSPNSDESTNYIFSTNHDNSGASNGDPSRTGDAPKTVKCNKRQEVEKWVEEGFLVKLSLADVRKKHEPLYPMKFIELKKFAYELAKNCLFGERTLSLSTISGRSASLKLDESQLERLKDIVRGASIEKTSVNSNGAR